jgi:hypothetical protein
VSGLYEVTTWLIYTLTAVMMLGVTAARARPGSRLRFVAKFLRGLGGGREEGDAQHAQDVPRTPT